MPSAIKKRKPGEVTLFHSSPAPHDRYLGALASSGLHDNIRSTVLAGTPTSNSHVVIVHGPPGTGKTAVVAEAIRRLAAQRGSKILCCAPSDEAADVLTRRVGELGSPSILRLNWWQRKQDSVAPALLRYCYTRDGQFDVPSRNSLKNKTVVITTCACARSSCCLHSGKYEYG